MNDLLDTILNGHGTAKVISENHDLGSIAVEESAITQALDGLGRVWDAAEYGISREEVARRMAETQTPEARERVIADLRERALRRASLDTSTGRVALVSARELPWSGLGVVVDRALTSAEARRFASLDWLVEKTVLSYQFNGETRTAEGVYGIVRQDTGRMLGSVGSRYAPIQNSEAFDFLDGVLERFGARYETAGAIYGGAKVWMLAHLPKQRFSVGGGSDSVEPYVLFTNCHDGSGAAMCFPTSVRVVCANTFRTAGHGRSKGISIRHTGSVKAKIQSAQSALGLAVESFDAFKESVGVMNRVHVNVEHYASDVLDIVLDVTAADALMGADVLAAAVAKTEATYELERKSFARKIERRGEILEDILARHESETCGVGGMRGTLWAAFNAVTEHADHNDLSKQSRDRELRLSRRFESVISGDADEMKQAAYRVATAES